MVQSLQSVVTLSLALLCFSGMKALSPAHRSTLLALYLTPAADYILFAGQNV